MNEGQLAKIDPKDTQLLGTLDPAKAFEHQRLLEQFIAKNMKLDEDFGKIPGVKKRSLYQPGAQKLLFYHGLGVRFEAQEETMRDWDKPFFYYAYKAIIFHKATGIVVAECIGSANSKESRYAWVWKKEHELSRDIVKEDLETKPAPWDNNTMLYRMPNPDICGLVNTIMKISQKRALVGGAITATRASAGFIPEDDAEQQRVAGGVETPAAPKGGGSNSKAAAPVGGGSNPISDKQRKMIFAKLKAIQKEPQDLHGYFEKIDPKVIDEKGDVHLSRIQRGDMTDLLKFMDERSADSGQEPS